MARMLLALYKDLSQVRRESLLTATNPKYRVEHCIMSPTTTKASNQTSSCLVVKCKKETSRERQKRASALKNIQRQTKKKEKEREREEKVERKKERKKRRKKRTCEGPLPTPPSVLPTTQILDLACVVGGIVEVLIKPQCDRNTTYSITTT